MSNPADKVNEFLMWIGHCITAWAKFEEHLFSVCRACLGARLDRAAIVYYRTPALDSRIKLVHELVCTVLPKPPKKSGAHPHPDLKQWNDLRNEITDLLAIRRRIAHHPVRATSAIEEKDQALFERTWLEIYMSENERLRSDSKDTEPLKYDDLVNHVTSVHDVTRRTSQFWRGILPKHL